MACSRARGGGGVVAGDSLGSNTAALRVLDGLKGEELSLGQRLCKNRAVRDWMNSVDPSTKIGGLLRVLLMAQEE